MKIKNTKTKTFRVILYVVLLALAALMLVPFVWMLSASFKLDKDVFIFPIQWIPENPRWQNYIDCLLYTSSVMGRRSKDTSAAPLTQTRPNCPIIRRFVSGSHTGSSYVIRERTGVKGPQTARSVMVIPCPCSICTCLL